MNSLQWLGSTIAVLTLIVLMGRAAKWVLGRGAFDNPAACQLAQWRIAPDATVRAVRVFDQVHLILESRKQSSTLQTLSVRDFEELSSECEGGRTGGLLELLPRRLVGASRTASAH